MSENFKYRLVYGSHPVKTELYIYIYIVIIVGEGERINTVEFPKLFYIYCDVGERKKRNLSPPKCNLGRRIPSVGIIRWWNMYS